MSNNQTNGVAKKPTIEELKDAFYNKKPIKIKSFGSHFCTHIEEIGCVSVIQNTEEGAKLFPGSKEATLGFVSAYELRKCGWYGEEGFFKALQNECLLIGVGGGMFDEHKDRERYRSCFKMVIDHLDLYKTKNAREIYGAIEQYITYEDNSGDNLLQNSNRIRAKYQLSKPELEIVKKYEITPDDSEILRNRRLSSEESTMLKILSLGSIAKHIKNGFELAGEDLEECGQVLQDGLRFFKIAIEQARKFVSGKEKYVQLKKHILPIYENVKPVMMVHIKSDCREMTAVVRSQWTEKMPEKLGVLFLEKSNGQFLLRPGTDVLPHQMREVRKILTQMVAWNKYQMIIPFRDLGADEVLDAVPELHFAPATGTISNGAIVDPKVPGLLGKFLSVEEVIDAIMIGLNTKIFPNEFQKGCKSGICQKKACWFYNFGLKRCHEIRNPHTETPMRNALSEAHMLQKN